MLRNILLVIIGLGFAYVGYQVYSLYRIHLRLGNVAHEYRYDQEDANLLVVEFLDYGCIYCRQVHPTIMDAISRDGKITYIPRPIAMLGPDSAYAAVVAYAAGRQDKFMAMHNAVMENFENLDDGTLPQIATSAGVDPVELQNELDAGVVQDYVIENIDLFNAIGGRATPTFIIGGKIFYVPEGQMPEVEDFLNMFEEARSKLGMEMRQ